MGWGSVVGLAVSQDRDRAPATFGRAGGGAFTKKAARVPLALAEYKVEEINNSRHGRQQAAGRNTGPCADCMSWFTRNGLAPDNKCRPNCPRGMRVDAAQTQESYWRMGFTQQSANAGHTPPQSQMQASHDSFFDDM